MLLLLLPLIAYLSPAVVTETQTPAAAAFDPNAAEAVFDGVKEKGDSQGDALEGNADALSLGVRNVIAHGVEAAEEQGQKEVQNYQRHDHDSGNEPRDARPTVGASRYLIGGSWKGKGGRN